MLSISRYPRSAVDLKRIHLMTDTSQCLCLGFDHSECFDQSREHHEHFTLFWCQFVSCDHFCVCLICKAALNCLVSALERTFCYGTLWQNDVIFDKLNTSIHKQGIL